MSILFSVAGLRAASLLPHHHSPGFPFTVAAPGRLLLLVLLSVAFLASWRVLYRR